MIYLIDDNKHGQMSQNYKFDFTTISRSYPDHIIWLQTLLESEIDTVLRNASCILIHDSFEAKEDKERLIATAKKRNIPYCIFSNGFAATVFEEQSIKEIKKDRLYNNLQVFIDQFKTSNKIDLKLLSLGINYEAEKASIIQDRLINGTLFNHRGNFNYEIAFPSGSQEYKDLMELVYLSDLFLDFSVFEDEYNSKETSAQSMREAVINMTKNVKQKYE